MIQTHITRYLSSSLNKTYNYNILISKIILITILNKIYNSNSNLINKINININKFWLIINHYTLINSFNKI